MSPWSTRLSCKKAWQRTLKGLDIGLYDALQFSGSASPAGDDGIRTHDPLLAGQVLSQLSYTPVSCFGAIPFSNEHRLLIQN